MTRLTATLIACSALLVLVPATALAAPAKQVTVGSYNVNNDKLSAGDGPDRRWTTARKNLVVDGFEKLNADIVSFQEATAFGTTQPAAQIAAEVKPAGRAYRLATSPGFRIGILYDTLKMTRTAGPYYVSVPKAANDATRQNIASFAKFRHRSGGEFWFVSLHLSVDDGIREPSSAKSEEWRQGELRTIVQTVRDRYAKGLPIAYAGDFNTYPGRKLDKGSQSKADAPGALMRAAKIVETGIPGGGRLTCDRKCSGAGYDTWHNWAGSRRGIKRMDRIFVSQAWAAVTGWRIVREVSAKASDHFPVKAFLQLP